MHLVGRQMEDAGEDGIMRIFMLVAEYKWEVRKMKNGTNGTFGTVVPNQKCIQFFFFGGGRTCRKWASLKDLGVHGRVLLKRIFEKEGGRFGLDQWLGCWCYVATVCARKKVR